MGALESSRKGSCRCGQVTFEVRSAPLVTMACHCRGCQQMTASAYSVSALYPAEQFQVLAGEPVIGGLHGATRHHFCPHCLSWLFTRPEGADQFVNVRATLLEDATSLPPFIDCYTQEKLPWAETGAQHVFSGFPDMDDYGRLIPEYAQFVATSDVPG